MSLVVGMLSLGFTIWIMPGIHATNVRTVAAGVIVLALLNAAVRPVLLGILTPFTPIALAIGTIVFQVVSFMIMGAVLPGLQVDGFLSAFIGSFVYAIINTTLTAVFATDEDESYWGALVRQLALQREGVIRSDKPGVVIIQIDGLAHPILTHQIRAGRVPFIAALDPRPQDAARQVDGAPAVADLGLAGRHPARQQQLHPGLPLVGEGHRAG